MTEETQDIILTFKIVLPYWIDIPNNSIFNKHYNDRCYKIEIKQDFWQINFQSNFQIFRFLAPEDSVIGRKFMKPRIRFDDINPLDLSQERQFEEEWHYSSKKVKTIIILNLTIPFMETSEDIINYIIKNNIWGDIKDLINHFLSIYTFIRINSNFKECPIIPLSNDFYTNENTIITYKNGFESAELYLDKINLYLKIPFFNNYHTLISDEQTLEFFKERLSRRRDLKLKLNERMKISIEFARRLRDINSIIINICIYLERVSIEFLSLKKDLDKSEMDILYKEKGLTHYVECQLPHFLENEVETQFIKDSIEIVRLRNEIIHFGSNFSFTKDLEAKCDNVLKLIEFLESKIRPDKKELDFIFKGKLVGRVLEIGPENLIKLLQFESELEANYSKRNEILLNKIPEDLMRKFLGISEDYQIFKLPDDFIAFCRIFFRENKYIMVFALDPTQNYLNLDFLHKTHLYIKEHLKMEDLKINFITQHIPPGTLNLFKKVAESKLKEIKEELNINMEYNYYSFIQFIDPKQQEIFAEISTLFNSKKNMMISEEEIYNIFDKNEIDNLFDYYPDFFQKKVINEQGFWIMYGKVMDVKSIR